MPHSLAELSVRWLFDAAPDAMLVIDRAGAIVSANPLAERLFGWTERELRNLTVEALLPERSRHAHVDQRERYHTSPSARLMGKPLQCRAVRRDGTEFLADVSLSPLPQSPKGLVLAAVRDITERRRAEEALYRERERALVTLASIGDAVITTDSGGQVDYLNTAAEALTGWNGREALGQSIEQVAPVITEPPGELAVSPVQRGQREGRLCSFEPLLIRRRDGSTLPIDYTVAPLLDQHQHVTGFAVVFHDAAEHRRTANRLSFEATHDSLTGLVNRAEFERRLAQLVHRPSADHVATLCFMDLDRFKEVNDSSGHAAGDEVLRQVARLLLGAVRQRDTVARLGGDEFTAILEGCPLPEATRIASEIQRKVASNRFRWGGRIYSVGVSVGVVPVERGGDPAALLLAADGACYASKAQGGVRVVVGGLAAAGALLVPP